MAINTKLRDGWYGISPLGVARKNVKFVWLCGADVKSDVNMSFVWKEVGECESPTPDDEVNNIREKIYVFNTSWINETCIGSSLENGKYDTCIVASILGKNKKIFITEFPENIYALL